jgi:hypothetical protein
MILPYRPASRDPAACGLEMSRIAGAFGVPHNPHFPTWSQAGHPLAAEIDHHYGAVAALLSAVEPSG